KSELNTDGHSTSAKTIQRVHFEKPESHPFENGSHNRPMDQQSKAAKSLVQIRPVALEKVRIAKPRPFLEGKECQKACQGRKNYNRSSYRSAQGWHYGVFGGPTDCKRNSPASRKTKGCDNVENLRTKETRLSR